MGSEINALTEAEREAGWELLFDGRTSTGWRGFRKESMPDGWQVVDGTLHRAASGGDIVTVETFESFELSLQWKHAGKGNSGIFFRVSEDHDEVWHTGPEYQVLNDAMHPNLKPTQMCGANYDLHPPSEAAAKPAGEWNETRLIVDGDHVEHWLNGKQVVVYELGSEDWAKRVAESKFHRFPKYGRNAVGHLALQDHNDPVWYRDIKLRRR
jgi:hypothetical protein